MPKNEYLKQYFESLRSSLMSIYSSGIKVPNDVKGTDREIFIKEFLNKTFSQRYTFEKGVITDSLNNISGALDIIIQWDYEPSFSIPGSQTKLFIAESCAAVIEVKSNFTQLTQAIETNKKIKNLKRKFSFYNGTNESQLSEKIPLYMVCYTGPSDVDKIINTIEKHEIQDRPDGILIIESGSFMGMNYFTPNGPIGLYAFVAEITDHLNSISNAKSVLKSYFDE